MKFEAQIGKSLWCVSQLDQTPYTQQPNAEQDNTTADSTSLKSYAIVTGGADSSLKLWSVNNANFEEDKANEPEILKYDYDFKADLVNLPFVIRDPDQYFIRSLCYCISADIFVLFASTNLGTIYCWRNENSSDVKTENEVKFNLNLKYVHSTLEDPSVFTDEYSIIDLC
mmetsp:Transcript_34273/g.39589  ORF Transcript_34273/g.39589 Transcript_34273/m.39589 type:complete len:170 (+) Transcript_34273:309-818(+)